MTYERFPGFGALALVLVAPLLVAATAPGQGLDTPTLLLMTTAIVGIILLRGVFLRRHLRKRRRGSSAKDREGSDTSDGSSDTSADSGGDGGN